MSAADVDPIAGPEPPCPAPPQLDAAERPPWPAIVIAVDQGEELFLAEGRSEADTFLSLLAGLLAEGTTTVIEPDSTVSFRILSVTGLHQVTVLLKVVKL